MLLILAHLLSREKSITTYASAYTKAAICGLAPFYILSFRVSAIRVCHFVYCAGLKGAVPYLVCVVSFTTPHLLATSSFSPLFARTSGDVRRSMVGSVLLSGGNITYTLWIVGRRSQMISTGHDIVLFVRRTKTPVSKKGVCNPTMGARILFLQQTSHS
ncbi:hypothetical protein QBC36DRAFT_51069 [Triangularia setosa]|uniref:Uncharacterized protein n=1 Tax=Triangularia setosa TaxID=2587417 RepID=A0AAN6W230_9PEZI|nr:hypothetical protein QBC36DRAFT_51069 [Podospora setosa]